MVQLIAESSKRLTTSSVQNTTAHLTQVTLCLGGKDGLAKYVQRDLKSDQAYKHVTNNQQPPSPIPQHSVR